MNCQTQLRMWYPQSKNRNKQPITIPHSFFCFLFFIWPYCIVANENAMHLRSSHRNVIGFDFVGLVFGVNGKSWHSPNETNANWHYAVLLHVINQWDISYTHERSLKKTTDACALFPIHSRKFSISNHQNLKQKKKKKIEHDRKP